MVNACFCETASFGGSDIIGGQCQRLFMAAEFGCDELDGV